MQQKTIRNHNGSAFKVDEASEWLKELNDRTQSDDEGYNSIYELGNKVKVFENNQVSGFISRKNLADLPPSGEVDVAYFVLDDATDANNNGTWYWDGSAYDRAAPTAETAARIAGDALKANDADVFETVLGEITTTKYIDRISTSSNNGSANGNAWACIYTPAINHPINGFVGKPTKALTEVFAVLLNLPDDLASKLVNPTELLAVDISAIWNSSIGVDIEFPITETNLISGKNYGIGFRTTDNVAIEFKRSLEIPAGLSAIRAYIPTTTGTASDWNYATDSATFIPFAVPYYTGATETKVLKIPTKSIGKEELKDDVFLATETLETQVNFFDISATTSENLGKYINTSNGQSLVNANYNVTGLLKIPIKFDENEDRILTLTVSYRKWTAFYDQFGAFISGLDPATNTFDFPANAVYINCTVSLSQWWDFTIVIGDTLPVSYTPFREDLTSNVNQFVYQKNIIVTDKFFLAPEFRVLVGKTVEIYNDEITDAKNYTDYSFHWETFGKSLDRKFSYDAVVGDIGTHELRCHIYDKSAQLVTTLTTNIVVVSNTVAIPINTGNAGDSTSRNKDWIPQVETLNPNITFHGTRGTGTQDNKNEGRSGVSSNYYVRGDLEYTADDFGYAGIDGRLQTLNPFWNPNTSQIDFAYYLSNYSIPVLDKLINWTGTNAITVNPQKNAGWIKQFIDALIATDVNSTEFYVAVTLFRSPQNGIGGQPAVDGYVPSEDWWHDEKKRVFNLMVELYRIFDSVANVTLIPLAQVFDSKYNYPSVQVPVNPYSTITETLETDSVHPQQWEQISDLFTAYLVD